MNVYTSPNRAWPTWIGMALGACLAVFVWEALSDEPQPTDGSHRVPVAVIDIAKVFKDHRRFGERMAGLKSDIEDFERYTRARQGQIAGIKADQPDKAAALEKELADEIALKRKLFLDLEADVYYEVYEEIAAHAEQVCRERDVGLLLRTNNDKMLKGDRASVLQGVNRAVVHCRVPDLTDDVLSIANAMRP